MRWIYLDYNATTPLAPSAQEAMLPYLADRYADPQADHSQGRVVAEALDDARSRVAAAVGAHADEIIWTSGATESSNLALRGLIEPALRRGETPHLVVSAVDHAAVVGPARFLASIGAEVTFVRPDQAGRIAADDVVAALRPETRLVSVGHANDELGTIQPLAEIAAACHDEGVPVHTDAAQTLGKTPIDVADLGVDLMSLSAHKAYGPKGVGALYVRRGTNVEPLLFGAGHEEGKRSGMPNVAGIVGFGAAAGVAARTAVESSRRLTGLRDRLQEELLAGADGATVYGPPNGERLANTLCVALPGVVAGDLLAAAPELAATACATGELTAPCLSPTLRAIGAEPRDAAGAIRLSVGWYTEDDEISRASDALLAAWERRV